MSGEYPLRALRRLVRKGGTVVLVGGEGSRMLGPMGRIARAALMSIGSNRRLRPLLASPDAARLDELMELVRSGQVRPVVERVWPFAEAADALARIESGRAFGKNVVTVGT